MPYIKKEDRVRVLKEAPTTGGELNFAVSDLIDHYIRENGLRYKTIEEVIGALEGAKYEFQRKVVAPYEDLKAHQNGEVFNESLQALQEVVLDG